MLLQLLQEPTEVPIFAATYKRNAQSAKTTLGADGIGMTSVLGWLFCVKVLSCHGYFVILQPKINTENKQ
jgi:hypothetical protein